MSITGGSVIFEQSRKLAEYENRKATVTFSVNEPEGQNAVEQVLLAINLARNAVFAALELAPPKPILGIDYGATQSPTKPVDPTDVSAPAPKPGRGKRPPVTVVDLKDPAKVEDATVVVDEPKGEVVEDPTKQPAATTAGSATQSAPAGDPAAVEDWAAAAPTVTDTELLAAITRKNSELQLALGPAAPPKIRALIGEFVTAPKGARDIPAEVRAAFLEKLAALKA